MGDSLIPQLSTLNSSPNRTLATAAMVVVAWLCCTAAIAHEGPPYPILVDQPIPDYLVSVWGDPDVGTGTFYVILEPAGSNPTSKEPQVELWVQPVSDRLERVHYPAVWQEMTNRIQYLSEPKFDRQEMWNVGFLIHPSDGETSELVAEVEVTPPGYGTWDLLIYLVPFLLFGGTWVLALLRRWRTKRGVSAGDLPPSATGRGLPP